MHSATVPGTWYNLYCSTSTLVVEYCRAAVWYYDIYIGNRFDHDATTGLTSTVIQCTGVLGVELQY